MNKLISIFLLLISTVNFAESTKPLLVVQLVVDQLRGDLLYQYQTKFGSSGFNYLFSHGIDYHNAHHPHANTVTCAGHATIATGTYPALHGIVSNDWYDRNSHQLVYCVEDKESSILPTQRTKRILDGRSPRHVVASTLSDEIVLAQTGRAFGVSLKDRSAITLAGHAGKAFWFDKENGGFVTSNYYYSNYPDWVKNWNVHYEPRNEIWSLMGTSSFYQYTNAPLFKNKFNEYGNTFPHQLGTPTSENYYKYLSMSPFADELTADFAINLLKNEKLGQNKGKTDYLAVSFSAVDAIGHQFGPNSLESEDNILRLDKTISKLLAAIDKEVGLNNTLIVLTADHGVSDAPDYLKSQHVEENPVISIARIHDIIGQGLNKKFNLPTETLQAIELPFIYLNHEVIQNHQLSMSSVTNYLVQLLQDQPGIFKAYSLPLTNSSNDWLSRKVDKMAFSYRAGDLYIVPYPFQGILDKSNPHVEHGTPWQYDSYVPLLFVNPNFQPTRLFKSVSTTDIAPTLAALLLIKFPSATTGKPLAEVLKAFKKSA